MIGPLSDLCVHFTLAIRSQCRNPILLSMRTLTTYLVLTSLLIGNAVGLVHVGCAGAKHHRQTSCSQTPVKSCSCHHQHGGLRKNSGDESQEPCPANEHEHDPDHCSVCQNFFATRNAVFSVTLVIDWKPLPMQRLSVEHASDATSAVYLCGLSVRGPPSV